jgi:uncharacterized protein (TIGR02266 family)
MADARKDRRTLLSLKIRYKSATLEDFIERYSMDISGGGVFIKAKKPLAVGTLLKFEFVLQDQSTLIHGVGRVVWRREEAEATDDNPAGMGIKFIKMDPESRSIVQRIVDDRAQPGAFDHGKEGVSSAPEALSEPPSSGADATRVSHVSEFLVTAFETGGAGATATREAREVRARSGTAIGAFKKPGGTGSRTPVEPPSRGGAASAFGGASLRSSAAPAMDALEDDDFLDNETTTVQALPTSDFPEPEADATVVAAESPFAHERRQTPVVPTESQSVSPLEAAVPDLFGPDSFGPAPGEVIDASLLDPAVATVPPKASALPRGAMPDSPAIPAEAFRVPQAPAPVRSEPAAAAPRKPKGKGGLLVLLLLLLLAAGGGVAAWQLGYLEGVLPDISSLVPVTKAPPVVETAPKPAAPAPAPEGDALEADSVAADDADTGAGEDGNEAADADAEPATEVAEAPSPDGATDGLVKIRITSVPKGAFVSVNGKGVGRAPVDVEYAAGTKLSIFSKARGFLARRQQVVVGADTSEVKLVLPTLPYEVEVVSDPPGARASAVGGGEVTTPGTLRFRSMPASRKIVVSKDGFSTMSVSVSRTSFVEEKTRMATSVSVTLAKEAAGATAAVEAVAPEAEAPSVEAAPEPDVEPETVEAAPSEPSADDVAE